MLSEKKKAMIWALHENEHCTKVEIAQKLGVSRNTVTKILKDKTCRDEQTSAKVKKLVDKRTESLIEGMVNDQRPKIIVDNILDLLSDPEVMKKELEAKGIHPIVGAMKVIVENQIKLAELNRPNRVIVENNVSEIVRLMNDAKPKEINPEDEIEEFQSEVVS